jgi:hypothetical protein
LVIDQGEFVALATGAAAVRSDHGRSGTFRVGRTLIRRGNFTENSTDGAAISSGWGKRSTQLWDYT